MTWIWVCPLQSVPSVGNQKLWRGIRGAWLAALGTLWGESSQATGTYPVQGSWPLTLWCLASARSVAFEGSPLGWSARPCLRWPLGVTVRLQHPHRWQLHQRLLLQLGSDLCLLHHHHLGQWRVRAIATRRKKQKRKVKRNPHLPHTVLWGKLEIVDRPNLITLHGILKDIKGVRVLANAVHQIVTDVSADLQGRSLRGSDDEDIEEVGNTKDYTDLPAIPCCPYTGNCQGVIGNWDPLLGAETPWTSCDVESWLQCLKVRKLAWTTSIVGLLFHFWKGRSSKSSLQLQIFRSSLNHGVLSWWRKLPICWMEVF